MNGDKMNIEYRKIFNRNYAILSDYNISDYKECYRSKMLKSNRLDNFLTYDTQNLNGTIQFTYDISSKQSVYSFYENCDIDYEMVRHLIMSLKSAFDTLNNYLLEPDFIVLDPRLIYMNIATKSIYFCYCPGEKNNFYDSLNSFLCYIISKIDHEDNNSIILAYSLQQQSTNKNYTFDDLMEIVNKQVFIHQEEHINPIEQKRQESETDFDDISDESFIESECILNNELKKEPPSTVPSMISAIPVCIFFITSSVILYAGIFQRLISTELMILAIFLSAFICFNIFNILKNKQFEKSILPTNMPEDELHSNSANIQNNDIKDDIKIEANYYEDTVILGYRSTEKAPRLVYTGTDFISEIELTSFPFSIGKMAENVTMVIDHPMISRIHAKIYFKENHYYIEDMNSSNGTYINNNLIQPHTLTEITAGDYITFSHLTYIFQ